MNCNEFEKLCLEGRDLTSGPLIEHLDGCATCRDTMERWSRLDRELICTLRPPQLPPDFQQNLMRRIQEFPRWTPQELAERRRQLEGEYRAGLAKIRPMPLPPRQLLVAWGYAALISLAGWLALQAFPKNGSTLLPAESDRITVMAVSGLIAAGCGVLAAVFPRMLRYLMPCR